jgi:hypothetical protein
MNMSSILPSAFNMDRKRREGEGEVRRHIERLLLRMDRLGEILSVEGRGQILSRRRRDLETAGSESILKGAGLG